MNIIQKQVQYMFLFSRCCTLYKVLICGLVVGQYWNENLLQSLS